jgi:flavin reductase (DIM6/NTAB) family NADH-FMN oxidoreductase RutF
MGTIDRVPTRFNEHLTSRISLANYVVTMTSPKSTTPHRPPDRDPSQLPAIDQFFRKINREIWIVTATWEGRRAGLTATWVSQASIDPAAPSVLIGLAPNHHTAQLIQKSKTFGLHLLRSDQAEVAWNFARDSSQDRDKFLEAPARTHDLGMPLLENCLGWLACRVVQRLEVADRWYFWADVLQGGLVPNSDSAAGSPADSESPADSILTEQVFFRSLTQEQRKALLERRDEDIELQRPWIAEWRACVTEPHGWGE